MNHSYMVARPERWRLPSLRLPFYLRSAGRHQLEYYINEYPGSSDGYVQVFWGISGEIELAVNGESMPLKGGDVIWKLKKESHSYKSSSPGGELRWFTFDGAQADNFILAYGYSRRLEGAGPCPVSLFLELERCLKDMGPYSQRRMIAIAAELLALAGRCLGLKEGATRLVEKVVETIQSNYQDAGLNVNELAYSMGCHRATLTRHFIEMMGVAPGEYLSRLRMQEASDLLRNSKIPIGEIGEKIGMPNHSHFSRAVKNATGMTPCALRRLGPDYS